MKTLVVKLAGTVEDSSLKKFGEFTLTAKKISAENYNVNTCRLFLRCVKNVTVEINGNGYITDESLSANLGKTYTALPNQANHLYFSNGDYTVTLSSKYDLTMFLISNGGVYNENLLSLDSSQFADMTGLEELSAVGLPTVSFDLSTLQYLTNMKYLRVHNNSGRISGNISNLAGMTKLKVATFDWLPNVTGDTSSIAHLHPNNGGALAEFNYTGSGVTGDWPPA